MIFSINGLKLVIQWDPSINIESLMDQLPYRGIEIESKTHIHPSFKGLIVGKIMAIEKVPNSEKLQLCQVFDGSKTLQIVCGGSGLQVNKNYILAPEGAQVGSITMAQRKVFGNLSQGMLCGWEEIGVALPGMTLIDDQFIPGTPLEQVHDWDFFQDVVYDISITPNRPDWLSLIGIGRELMAMEPSIKWKNFSWNPMAPSIDNNLNIQINTPLCQSFYTTIIENPPLYTPLWLKLILQNNGLKSINFPVDLSNWLLKKYGHPSHCYPLFQGAQVTMVQGESMVGLDGHNYDFQKPSLVLKTQDDIQCLIGIMGAQPGYREGPLVLELAQLDRETIRQTAKSLKISTNASHVFSRWVDPLIHFQVVQEFIGYLGQGESSLRFSNTKNHCNNGITHNSVEIFLPNELWYKRAGYELSLEKQLELLKTIGFQGHLHKNLKDDGTDNGNWGIIIKVPHWRTDMTIPENLVEETIRLDNINQYKSQFIDRLTFQQWGIEEKPWYQQNKINNSMVHRNYQQVINNVLQLKKTETSKESIDILQSSWSLKDSLMGDLIKNFNHGVDQGYRQFNLFETGKIFFYPKKEIISLGALKYDFNGNQQDLFMEARRDLENLIQQYGQIQWLKLQDGPVSDFYHPLKSCQIVYNNEIIGAIGVINSTIAFNSPVVLWEIEDIEKIFERSEEIFERSEKTIGSFNPQGAPHLKTIDVSFFYDGSINEIIQGLYDTFKFYTVNIIDIYQNNSYTLEILWFYASEHEGSREKMNQMVGSWLQNQGCKVR
jgi:phenylalanyl-tRNA synthetase beta chain